jgi:hypothetical protein
MDLPLALLFSGSMGIEGFADETISSQSAPQSRRLPMLAFELQYTWLATDLRLTTV